jgi:hypothetical protein
MNMDLPELRNLRPETEIPAPNKRDLLVVIKNQKKMLF